MLCERLGWRQFVEKIKGKSGSVQSLFFTSDGRTKIINLVFRGRCKLIIIPDQYCGQGVGGDEKIFLAKAEKTTPERKK